MSAKEPITHARESCLVEVLQGLSEPTFLPQEKGRNECLALSINSHTVIGVVKWLFFFKGRACSLPASPSPWIFLVLGMATAP